MSSLRELEAQYLQTGKPDFESFLQNILANGDLSDEELDAIARFFEHKQQYTNEVRAKLATLSDHAGDDRGITGKFQQILYGRESGREIDNVMGSGTYAQFWAYYNARKNRAPQTQEQAVEQLPESRNQYASLSAVLTDVLGNTEKLADNGHTLSHREVELIAEMLGDENQSWNATKARIGTIDTALGKAFQKAIGHTENDGDLGPKTIQRFWAFRRQRMHDYQLFIPGYPVTPKMERDLLASNSLFGHALESLERGIRSGQRFSIADLGYVRGLFSLRNTEIQMLLQIVGARTGKPVSEMLGRIVREFGVSIPVTDFVSESFRQTFLRSISQTDNAGDTHRITAREREAQLQGTRAPEFLAQYRGRHVNPEILRQRLEQHLRVLKNRSDDEIRIDWEAFTKTILTKDIPDLLREKDRLISDSRSIVGDWFIKLSRDSQVNTETSARMIAFLETVAHDSMRTIGTTLVNGQRYDGGILESLASSYPRVDMGLLEHSLRAKSIFEISEIANAAAFGRAPQGYPSPRSDAERQQLQDVLLALHTQLKENIETASRTGVSERRDGSVDARIAQNAIGSFAGLNGRMYGHYAQTSRPATTLATSDTLGSGFDLESPQGRMELFTEAQRYSGVIYYGGVLQKYAQRYPRVDMEKLERALEKKTAFDVARFATTVMMGQSLPGYPRTKSDTERRELRDAIMIVYGHLKGNIVSGADTRLNQDAQSLETDVLRQRNELLSIQLVIMNEIMNEKEITRNKRSESYIGNISIEGIGGSTR
ncbi:MAG TPA: hypothetical protein PK765_04110 [bacterium]|nr:hypothetical protein [bacterium]